MHRFRLSGALAAAGVSLILASACTGEPVESAENELPDDSVSESAEEASADDAAGHDVAGDGVEDADDAPPAEPEGPPEPSVPAISPISGTVEFDGEDHLGYTFSGVVTFAVLEAGPRIEDAPPGTADLAASLVFETWVENTTDGRNATFIPPVVLVYLDGLVLRVMPDHEPSVVGGAFASYSLPPGQMTLLTPHTDRNVVLGRFDEGITDDLVRRITDGDYDGFEVAPIGNQIGAVYGARLYRPDGTLIGDSDRTVVQRPHESFPFGRLIECKGFEGERAGTSDSGAFREYCPEPFHPAS